MTKTIQYKVMRCSHLVQWKQVLAILRLTGFFLEVGMVKGKQKDSRIFWYSQRLKKKVLQSLEKRAVYLISPRGTETTASVLAEQCKVPEQGSANLSDQVAVRVEVEFLHTKS